MSFTEITSDFEGTVQHLKQGAASVAVLNHFFKAMRKGVDAYSSSLLKIGQNLRNEMPHQGMDTLSTAVSAFSDHISQLTAQYNALGNNLNLELIEPLDLFYEHYNASNFQEISRGTDAYSRVKKARETMHTLQQKYFKASREVERYETNPQRTQKQLASLRTLASRTGESYVQAYEQTNLRWAEYDEVIPRVMENLQQNEESRVHFIKYTLEKYTKIQQRTAAGLAAITSDLSTVVSNISSSLDIRVYVDSHRKKHSEVPREEFLSFEAWKQRTREASAASVEPNDFITLDDEWEAPTDTDVSLIEAIVNTLIPVRSEGSGEEEVNECSDYSKLTELLQSPEGRALFCDTLEKRKQDCSLTSYNLTQLAAVFNSILTCILVDNDTDPCSFYRLILLAQTFYCQSDDGRRRYMSSLISSHQLWAVKSRWESCIEWVTMAKISADRESAQKLKTKQHAPKKGIMGAIRSITSKIPAVLKKEIADERADKSAAFMVLSQFNFHMINLGLPIESACDVVLKSCSKANLDSERTCVLLAELQANQRGSKSLVAGRKINRSSGKKRERLGKKWGELLPIAQSLEYLDIDSLLTVVRVNKLWQTKFRKQVFQVQLQLAPPNSAKLFAIRSQFWMYVLQPHMRSLDYPSILEAIQLNPELVKQYIEIIQMDVARSFHNYPQITSKNLQNLLRTYAYFNTEVGYCQGMNYIAGTLYLQMQDEEKAFKCMVGLIDKFYMAPLFYKNLPRLKLYLYQLDRLIGINLPEIHSLFKEEMITSSHFASAWFITLFSSVLHQTPDRFSVLLQVWDMFLVQGWKAIFKVGLAILMRLSDKLVLGKFEEMMGILTNINSPTISSEIFDSEFIERAKGVAVTNSLLRDLESEYEHLKLRASALPH